MPDKKLSFVAIVNGAVDAIMENLGQKDQRRAAKLILKRIEENNFHPLALDNDSLLDMYDRWTADGMTTADFARLIVLGNKRNGIKGSGARGRNVAAMDHHIRDLLRKRRRGDL
jgi:hypothetical protein